MVEITPRFAQHLDLPRGKGDLAAPEFHHALNDARGPDGQGARHGTAGIGLGATGLMYANFSGFVAPGLGAPGGGAGGDASAFGASKPVLSKGSKGADVQTAEDQINGWRAENGRTPIAADGKYDQQTESAVRDFQKANNMEINGSIGASTHDRLQLENDTSFKTLDPATKALIRGFATCSRRFQISMGFKLSTTPRIWAIRPISTRAVDWPATMTSYS